MEKEEEETEAGGENELQEYGEEEEGKEKEEIWEGRRRERKEKEKGGKEDFLHPLSCWVDSLPLNHLKSPRVAQAWLQSLWVSLALNFGHH